MLQLMFTCHKKEKKWNIKVISCSRGWVCEVFQEKTEGGTRVGGRGGRAEELSWRICL